MTSRSPHRPSSSAPTNIIDLAPRRRLRHHVANLLELAAAPHVALSSMLRLIADANATFGDEVIAEMLRAIHRDVGDAAAGIALCSLIATPAARTALWSLAHDHHWSAAIHAEALGALARLGEPNSTVTRQKSLSAIASWERG